VLEAGGFPLEFPVMGLGEELAWRRAEWQPPKPHSDRGWVKLHCATVTQADEGVDLDFIVGKSGAKVGRQSH
jgi:dihydroxy-acid dehydratase